ncbi:hypothetical protein IE4803_PD00223 (plasmid) [Rhizobium etli bv. phaseoli str. IE4803]|nr:hypothetical protein IE4803_PD00223 [Rhizobium etli bv. phaseoli str. IE4803]
MPQGAVGVAKRHFECRETNSASFRTFYALLYRCGTLCLLRQFLLTPERRRRVAIEEVERVIRISLYRAPMTRDMAWRSSLSDVAASRKRARNGRDRAIEAWLHGWLSLRKTLSAVFLFIG